MSIRSKILFFCLIFLVFEGILGIKSVVIGDPILEDNFESEGKREIVSDSVILLQDNSFVASASHFVAKETRKKVFVVVTAYSSTPWETDDTPFITASGTRVRDGIVAANFLPFGTKIKIPQIFGDKIFVVEDRLSPEKKYHIDVWFPSHKEALRFGAHLAYIEILN